MISRGQAREAERYDAIKHEIPDAAARAEAMCEDLREPAEREAHGIENVADAVEVVTEKVVAEIESAPLPAEDRHFIDDEADRAREVIPEIVRQAGLGLSAE
ncbi:hypothetical protein [Halorubrum sp. Atlit-26R]|uniref:hypothetical protein n=1 Tax=Halorubrum sp. Atlit-26R TaxID=2282128 RepID=UPI000EF1DB5A|nr:hypothetical protein [Halorubrum sp. Atlit-26R]RLM68490.1 hypothetical protein DVK07_10220 [Halorubrum sp. Atlit-26R]